MRRLAKRSLLKSMIVSTALAVMGLMAGPALAQSGSLEPPGSAVDGGGDPAPTTQTQPSWDQTLDASNGDGAGCDSTRFKCVMGGDAVLDIETGLVWEKAPGDRDNSGAVDAADKTTWASAQLDCRSLTTGNRRAWRLPTVHELASLLDPSSPAGLSLGHPFSDIQTSPTDGYWTGTSSFSDPTTLAFAVGIGTQTVGLGTKGSVVGHVWCVRGSQNHAATE